MIDNNSYIKGLDKVKRQALATVLAVFSAVVLPQVFHLIGWVSGIGNSLGELLLPMHLPIILVGLLAGPYVGAISGLLSPLVSYLLSGMPSALMLPFMMIELFGYGLLSGLFKNVKINSFFKVLLAQLGGRAVRAIALIMAVYLFGNESLNIATIWVSIPRGLLGILLQWSLIPLVIYRLEGRDKN